MRSPDSPGRPPPRRQRLRPHAGRSLNRPTTSDIANRPLPRQRIPDAARFTMRQPRTHRRRQPAGVTEHPQPHPTSSPNCHPAPASRSQRTRSHLVAGRVPAILARRHTPRPVQHRRQPAAGGAAHTRPRTRRTPPPPTRTHRRSRKLPTATVSWPCRSPSPTTRQARDPQGTTRHNHTKHTPKCRPNETRKAQSGSCGPLRCRIRQRTTSQERKFGPAAQTPAQP